MIATIWITVLSTIVVGIIAVFYLDRFITHLDYTMKKGVIRGLSLFSVFALEVVVCFAIFGAVFVMINSPWMYMTHKDAVRTPITNYVTTNNTVLVTTELLDPISIKDDRLLENKEITVNKVLATNLWGYKEYRYEIQFEGDE
jgi:hypothetical protein